MFVVCVLCFVLVVLSLVHARAHQLPHAVQGLALGKGDTAGACVCVCVLLLLRQHLNYCPQTSIQNLYDSYMCVFDSFWQNWVAYRSDKAQSCSVSYSFGVSTVTDLPSGVKFVIQVPGLNDEYQDGTCEVMGNEAIGEMLVMAMLCVMCLS